MPFGWGKKLEPPARSGFDWEKVPSVREFMVETLQKGGMSQLAIEVQPQVVDQLMERADRLLAVNFFQALFSDHYRKEYVKLIERGASPSEVTDFLRISMPDWGKVLTDTLVELQETYLKAVAKSS